MSRLLLQKKKEIFAVDKINVKNYRNPTWEPVFADISPLLAKLYFRIGWSKGLFVRGKLI